MGFNNSLASYIALALSPHLASHRLQENDRMQQDLEIEYHRLMNNRTIQEVFEKASLKYFKPLFTKNLNFTEV